MSNGTRVVIGIICMALAVILIISAMNPPSVCACMCGKGNIAVAQTNTNKRVP